MSDVLKQKPVEVYKIADDKIEVRKLECCQRYNKTMVDNFSFVNMYQTVNRFLGDEDHAFATDVGQFQYLYKNNKGTISLMETHGIGHNWEIYCLEGDIFDDIETFDSKEKAEARVVELMA